MSILDIDQTKDAVLAGDKNPEYKMRFDYFAERKDQHRINSLLGLKRSFFAELLGSSDSYNPLRSNKELFAEIDAQMRGRELLGLRSDLEEITNLDGRGIDCDRCGTHLQALNQALGGSPGLCFECESELDQEFGPPPQPVMSTEDQEWLDLGL